MKGLAPDSDQFRYLDGFQLAMKLLANATSYGALVEVNSETDTDRKQRIKLYAGAEHTIRTHTFEKPGPYFAGPVGTLIPAAGRLFLAIAERLAADRGLGYVFCDTDSMAFARPEGLAREEFHRLVQEVVDWFTPLSPYQKPGPLLQIEDVNSWQEKSEPLFCVAVSAKRYALYNRLDDGTFRIRKFSAHGTGDLMNPPASLTDTPEPCDNVYKLGGARWRYDLWYRAITRFEQGSTKVVVNDPALDVPALTRLTITTAHLLKIHGSIPDLRPFSFICVLPALSKSECFWRDTLAKRAAIEAGQRAGASVYTGLEGVTFYAPYGNSIEDLRGKIRRSDTHELVEIEHKTLNERLVAYFQHLEAKSAPADGVGLLARRHVYVYGHVFIGKESNAIKDDTAEESGDIVETDGPEVYVREGLSEVVKAIGVPALAATTGIARQTLYDIAGGARPSAMTAAVIRGALTELMKRPGKTA